MAGPSLVWTLYMVVRRESKPSSPRSHVPPGLDRFSLCGREKEEPATRRAGWFEAQKFHPFCISDLTAEPSGVGV